MSISNTRGRQFLAIGLAAVSLTLGGCAAPTALLDTGANTSLAPQVATVPGATRAEVGGQPTLEPTSESPFTPPNARLYSTGESVPCLDQFVEMMVDWGYATEDELAALSRGDLERLIILQTEQAGITIDELCSTLMYNDNVLEA